MMPDLEVSGANRPTITLVPGDNGETIQRFLTPVPMETLLFLTETSWPVAVILRLWVERLNGVPNAVTASGPARASSKPVWRPALQLAGFVAAFVRRVHKLKSR